LNKWFGKRTVRLLTMFAVLFGAFAAPAAAAETIVQPEPSAGNVDMYLRLDGIAGDVKTKGYSGAIKISHLEFDASRASGDASRTGGAAGKAELGDITIIKSLDASSVPILLSVLTGKEVKSAEIVVVSRGAAPTPLYTIQLSNVVLSNYHLVDTNESVRLSYAAMTVKYTKDGANVEGTWDRQRDGVR